MSEKPTSSRRIYWLGGLAFALAVHVAGLLFFQVGKEDSALEDIDRSFVSLPSSMEADGDLLREQAYLLDSTPLFLPTSWNAASSPAVEGLERRPGDLFDSFPVRLSYAETDFGFGAISSVEPGSTLENLAEFPDRSHVTFGRAEVSAPDLASRFALVEVVGPSGGEPVLTLPLPEEGAPEAEGQLWKPAEFLIQVTPVGLTGEPVLLEGSGVEAVDEFLLESIEDLTHEQMLEPGYYRVLAGP